MSNNANKFLKDLNCIEERQREEKPEEYLEPKLKYRNLKRDFIDGEGRCKYL